MRLHPMRTLTATLLTGALAVTLSACEGGDNAGGGNNGQTQSQDGRDLLHTDGPEVIADADGSGLEVSQRLFTSAKELVVAADDAESQRAAATEAIKRNVPMVVKGKDNASAIVEEADRLEVKRVVLVGEVSGIEGDFDVEKLPVEEKVDPAQAPADGAEKPIDQGTTVDVESSPDEKQNEKESWRGKLAEEVAGMDATGKDHPVALPAVFATTESSPAALATTKAAGGEVHLLEYPDPRLTSESMKIATGGDTLALGQQFGDKAYYEAAVDMADNGELPGGGGLVFPGRRMVAYYGHPSGDALGVMGENPPEEAVKRLEQQIEGYQPLEEQPVIPAFEIIVTVASASPGDDGKYSNTFPVEDYVAYVDAITEAGGYAVLDLQPGRASLLEQAKMFEELLKRPNVGLALDPEWKIGPDELPMQRIGHVEAAEVNEVADWLAQLTRENDLPQKALVLHQFQAQMIRDRETINTSHPELAFVLHADGHGTPDLKFETWNAMQEGLSGEWFMAWKNFIDEDTPTFSPEQTYNDVDPRPWFVSYQ